MGLTQASVVALGIFVVGLIYKAGQHAQRLDTVERDQNRVYDELRKINEKVTEVIGWMRPQGHG